MTTTTRQISPRQIAILRKHLATIHECLHLGISLQIQGSRGMREFVARQITDDIATDTGSVRTTHLREDLRGYVWMTKQAIATLATQATGKLARKDEILAEQARRHRVAMGRD